MIEAIDIAQPLRSASEEAAWRVEYV